MSIDHAKRAGGVIVVGDGATRARLRLLGWLGVASLLLVLGCSRLPLGRLPASLPPPGGATSVLPETGPQQVLVRAYLDLLAQERYPEGWTLLAPARQQYQGMAAFETAWRARGQVIATPDLGPYIWPAAEDEVRADVWLHQEKQSGLTRMHFTLQRIDGGWRIADEDLERDLIQGQAVRSQAPLTSPEQVVWSYVTWSYGPMYLATVDILEQEPFDDGQIVIFRSLSPMLERGTGGPAKPIAILLYTQRYRSGWGKAGGGTIGTVAEMERRAVTCAWTWLHYWPNEPTVAAFYCVVEDPRVAAIALTRVDGAVMRAEVAGRRAVVFPYAWDVSGGWPAQQAREIHLFDASGDPLNLPVFPLVTDVP
jgi:hypothetical protein